MRLTRGVHTLPLNHHHHLHMGKLKRRSRNANTSGGGLTKLPGKPRARQGGIIVVGPSGVYRDVRRTGPIVHAKDDKMTSDSEDQMSGIEEENGGDTPIAPLTKKEKQAISWIDGVNSMIPWFLDLLKSTENLGAIEIAHKRATLCEDCIGSGKAGFKVVCLYFNSKSCIVYRTIIAKCVQNWRRDKSANVAMEMEVTSQ